MAAQHAVIEYRDHAYWIRDQGSLNGTFVNGTRIEAEVRLNHGDLIGFYDHQFRFGMPSMEASDKTVLAGDIGTDADRTVLAGLGSTSVPPQDTPAPARPPAREVPPAKAIEPQVPAAVPGAPDGVEKEIRELVGRFQDDPLIDFDTDDSESQAEPVPQEAPASAGGKPESLISQFDSLAEEPAPDSDSGTDITEMPKDRSPTEN